MNTRNWNQLKSGEFDAHRFICVGLDVRAEELKPEHIKYREIGENCSVRAQNIVRETHKIAGFYKINYAFWARYGLGRIKYLFEWIRYSYPNKAIIFDGGKFSDTINTNREWAEFAFDILKADAVTVHWNYGAGSLLLFIERPEKGVLVVCRGSEGHSWTENVLISSKELSHLALVGAVPYSSDIISGNSTTRFNHIAYEVLQANGYDNLGLVVSGQFSHELRSIRHIVGDEILILSPDFGFQGAKLQEAVPAGINKKGRNYIAGTSRSITNSNDPRLAICQIHEAFMAAI